MRRYIRAGLAARAALAGWSDRASLGTFRDDRIRRLVDHAYRRVPHYRELFDRHGVRPGGVRGEAELARVPPTARPEIQRRSAGERVAAGVDPARLIENRTSGSSGTALSVRRTRLERNVLRLFRLREARSHGLKPRDRAVSVAAVTPAARRDAATLAPLPARCGLYRLVRIDARLEPEEILARLLEAPPDVVGGYPGVLARVAGLMGGAERRRLRPRVVRTESEVLTPHMRRRIEAGFDAPVRDTYACFEVDVIASECPETGAMHVCDDSVIVEVLRDGERVSPGERGEVVVTGLHSYAMPFIRYRIGDLATRGEDGCACGAPFSTLSAIEGRLLDLFRLPDGRLLHPYAITGDLIETAGRRLEACQLVQERPDRIVVRVVPAAAATVDDLSRWAVLVRNAVGSRVEVELRPVEDIALDASGRFRVAHSLVASDADR